MNNKWYVGLFLSLLLAAYLYNGQKACAEKSTLLVQALSTVPTLTNVIDELAPVANDIIKQELGLNADYDFEFFIPKPLQRLTLYYVNDMCADGQQLLLDKLEKVQQLDTIVKKASVSSNVEFFGDQKDELVMLIDDPDGELTRMHYEVKRMVYQADGEYKKTHDRDLYDRAHSERFPFLPHISLGRIRTHSITLTIKDESLVHDTFERIKEKIKNAAQEIIKKTFTLANQKYSFNKIGIFDPTKRMYIKEWVKSSTK